MIVINASAPKLRASGRAQNLKEWLDADPRHVYIGRACPWVAGAEVASQFANPFKLRNSDRAECLRLYEAHLRGSPALMRALRALPPDAELACWCTPQPCHGDVMARVAREQQQSSSEA
jgi:hypothetical protein